MFPLAGTPSGADARTASDAVKDLAGLVKDSWRGDTPHVLGCPGAVYLAGECSTACRYASARMNKLTRAQIKSLPYDHSQRRGGGVENYG